MKRIFQLVLAVGLLSQAVVFAGEAAENFRRAVESGDDKSVEKILKQKDVDINARNFPFNATALHIAVAKGYDKIAKMLLAVPGVNINAKGLLDATALHESAALNRIELAKLLLNKGADANAKNRAGNTPLHFAVNNDNLEIARLLLKHHSNPNALNNAKEKPFDIAERKKSDSMMWLLFNNGADVKTLKI